MSPPARWRGLHDSAVTERPTGTREIETMIPPKKIWIGPYLALPGQHMVEVEESHVKAYVAGNCDFADAFGHLSDEDRHSLRLSLDSLREQLWRQFWNVP